MKPGSLAIFLLVAISVACGGGSSNPSGPSGPTPPTPRGTSVDAPPITIGEVESNPNVGNTNPFGAAGGVSFPATTYQQVYLGSLFGSSQVRLTGIEFFALPRYGPRPLITANYTFSLSSTARAVDGLDTVSLASNVGANQQVVFSGILGQGAIVDYRFRLNFSNPFTFTPGSGNLLLHVVRSNPGPDTQAAFLNHVPNDGFPSGQSSRASDFSNGHAGLYLVTRFYNQRCECPPGTTCTC